MLKVCLYASICALLILFVPSIKNEDIDEEDDNDYKDNTDYDSLGKNEQLGELRPLYPLNHYFGSGPQSNLQEVFHYKRPHKRPGQKKHKILRKKGYKYIVPLLLNVLAKLAAFLPVAKLTLLALFTLVLFSKKALLVSIGSLILVIYDNFYNKKHKNTNIVKERVSTVPTIDQGPLLETNLEGWWSSDEIRPSRIDGNGENIMKHNGRRWWAPQINYKKTVKDFTKLGDSKLADDSILNELVYS